MELALKVSVLRTRSFHHSQTDRAAGLLRVALLVLLSALCLSGGARVWAQEAAPYDPVLDQGLSALRPYHGGDIDRIDLATGNLILHIPLVSYPQRGGVLHLDFFVSYTSPAVYQYKAPDNGPGYWLTSGECSGGATLSVLSIVDDGFPGTCVNRITTGTDSSLIQIWIVEGDGSVHPMGYLSDLTASNIQERALDNSGFYVNAAGGIVDRNGVTTTSDGSGVISADPNGNEMSASGGGAITDTMGRIIPVALSGNVPGPNGGTVQYLWSNTSTERVLKLPNGTAYTFQSAEIPLPLLFKQTTAQSFPVMTQITLPTGGTISYTYGSTLVYSACGTGLNAHFPVLTRTVNANDGTGSHTWTYSYSFPTSDTSSGSTTVTDPLGNKSVHTFGLGCRAPDETEVQYYGSNSALLKTVTTSYSYISASESNTQFFNVVPTSVVTAWPNGQQKTVSYTYDRNNGHSFQYSLLMEQIGSSAENFGIESTPSGYTSNPWTSTETDYGGTVLRTTTNSYEAFSNSAYLTGNLLDLPSSTQVEGAGSGSLTDYDYDESETGVHGNLTSIHRWLNTTSGYLVTNNAYDSYGRLTSTSDPKQNQTKYLYSSGYAGSGPTSVTNALNQTTYYNYDFNTGLPTSATDPNGQTTNFSYDPQTWRETQIQYPDGGETAFCYSDTPNEGCASGPPYEVTTTKKMSSSQNLVEAQIIDGLGRLSKTELTSDPDGTDYTVTTYNGDGQVATKTNPYRSTSDSTYGVTSFQYDGLSRTVLIQEPDSSKIQISYTGNCSTVTDEAGGTRESCTDGLGRLSEVIENPGGLNYVTTYGYDALDNLTSVAQGGSRQRSFVYDSLSRLTRASNPESGTTSYTHDSDGNVATRTDARSITTTYSYDALNRLTAKSYSDGTPSESFVYDVNNRGGVTEKNTVGRLVVASVSGIASTLSSYDPMGRVITQWQCAPLNCGDTSWPFSYTYDLTGDMTSQALVTIGITYTQSYNGAGRATQLTSNWVDSQHPATIVSGVQYNPAGEMASATFGNSLSETAVYNARLQPCRSNLNSSGTLFSSCSAATPSGSVLDLTMGFNYGSGDNGNLMTWSAAGPPSFSKTYTYDALNRLASMSSPGNACTGLTWNYDAWGNLTDQTVTGGTCETLHQMVNANNQFIGAPYEYDAAGNMTHDASHRYTYDAENRLTEVDGGATATYVYDALGRRVEKTLGGVSTYYNYDLSGHVIAEYECQTCMEVGYIYLNGQSLAEYYGDTTYFYYDDHLGSTRLLTGYPTASVVQCEYYYPYGDNVPCGSEELTTHKFTSKERDSESYLDNFGARYFSSLIGRFMSPDWSSVPTPVPYADLTNPQTLNLYAMARDNPVSFADLDGHCSSAEDCPYVDVVAATEAEGGDLADANSGWNDAAQQQNSQGQGQGQGQQNQQPASWDKTKPFPDNPSKLGPDWKKNPKYKNPNGEEYINDKTGEKMEWNKGRPGPWGPKADRGRDGWHYTPPGGVRGKQMDPGQVLRTATKVGFWGAAGAITIKILQAAGEACAEGACY